MIQVSQLKTYLKQSSLDFLVQLSLALFGRAMILLLHVRTCLQRVKQHEKESLTSDTLLVGAIRCMIPWPVTFVSSLGLLLCNTKKVAMNLVQSARKLGMRWSKCAHLIMPHLAHEQRSHHELMDKIEYNIMCH